MYSSFPANVQVGMAISQAANLYKQHQQAGTAQGSQQDAMNSAASMVGLYMFNESANV